MSFNKSDLEELVKTKVNEKNFLTFSKLLSLEKGSDFRAIIDLVFNNLISLSDLEALPIIDDIEIRKFLASYEVNTSYHFTQSTKQNSTFDVRSYMYNESSPVLLRLKELNEEVNLNGDFSPTNILSPTVSVVSYSSITEAKTEFKEKVVPELKKYLSSTRNLSFILEDLRLYISGIQNLEEKEFTLNLYESLFGFYGFKDKFNDEGLFEILLNTYQDFSIINLSNFQTDYFINTRVDIDTFRKLFSESCMILSVENKEFGLESLQELKQEILESSKFMINHATMKVTIAVYKNLLYRYIAVNLNVNDNFNIDPHVAKILEVKETIKNVMIYSLDFLVTKYMRVMYR